MNVALWIVQILLAPAFLMAGGMKLMQPKETLAEKMGWVEDFSQNTIRVIGSLEVLGAILAAVGLAATMVGAIITHVRRGEYPNVIANIVLLVLALFVAYGRFILLPF